MKDFKHGRIYDDNSPFDQISEFWDSNKPNFLKKYDNWIGTGPSYNQSEVHSGFSAISVIRWIFKIIAFICKLIFKIIKGLIDLIIGVIDRRNFNKTKQHQQSGNNQPLIHNSNQGTDYTKFMK